MHASSTAQFAASNERRTPEVEEVRPGVWSLPLEIPSGLATVQSTLCYVYLGESGVAVVDPGWDLDENAERLRRFLAKHGRTLADVSLAIVSHLHFDHHGLANRLALGGTPLAMHRWDWEESRLGLVRESEQLLFAGWGIPPDELESVEWSLPGAASEDQAEPEFLLAGGEVLDVAGTPLRVIHTPGHTRGSICLVDETNGLLLTGDHVLPNVRPGVGLGRGPHFDPIGDYLGALDALAPYDDLEVLPGHGYRFTGLRGRREDLAAHHLRRSGEIAAILDTLSSPSVWAVATRVQWKTEWSDLRGHLRRSALAQTEMHMHYLQRRASPPVE